MTVSRGGVSLAELSRRLDIMAGNGYPPEQMIACARADGLLTARQADTLRRSTACNLFHHDECTGCPCGCHVARACL